MENKKTGAKWREEQIARRDETVAYVRQLMADGYTVKEIATKIGFPEAAARALAKRYPWGNGEENS